MTMWEEVIVTRLDTRRLKTIHPWHRYHSIPAPQQYASTHTLWEDLLGRTDSTGRLYTLHVSRCRLSARPSWSTKWCDRVSWGFVTEEVLTAAQWSVGGSVGTLCACLPSSVSSAAVAAWCYWHHCGATGPSLHVRRTVTAHNSRQCYVLSAFTLTTTLFQRVCTINQLLIIFYSSHHNWNVVPDWHAQRLDA